MKEKGSTAFIVELFIMFAIMLLVIVVVTEVFMAARKQSLEAKELTEAVIAAGNTAEALSGARDDDEAVKLVRDMENSMDVRKTEDGLDFTLEYNGRDGSGKKYSVKVVTDEDRAETGRYVSSAIRIFSGKSGEELYRLDTGSYRKEAGE